MRSRNMVGWLCDAADKTVLTDLLLNMSAKDMNERTRRLDTDISLSRV